MNRTDESKATGQCTVAIPTVLLGRRRFTPTSWTRIDSILLGDTKIGIIKLSEKDRRGITICLATSAQSLGRQLQWCVDQYLRKTQPA